MASPNTFTISNTIFANMVFDQFRELIAPLSAFARTIEINPTEQGTYVQVHVIGTTGGTVNTKTDHGNYTIDGVSLTPVNVTLGSEKYVGWGVSDFEKAMHQGLDINMFAAQKAKDLAANILQDVLGVVTIANFATVAFAGAPQAFGTSDLVDIRTKLRQAYLNPADCSLIINADYYGQLLKELNYSVTGEASALRAGSVGKLVGLKQVIESELIPTNSENLKGLVAHPSSIAVGMRYLQPQEGHVYSEARAMMAENEAVVGYRRWHDPNSGVLKNIMNCQWGKYKVLDGIMRITS